ncbi:uncharacterized protein METZ01_LOCUS394133, partial [marine metagenome]
MMEIVDESVYKLDVRLNPASDL